MGLDLFGFAATLPSPPKEKAFDGESYQASQDHARLRGQLLRVHECLSDRKWHTLAELAELAGGSEASVSARIRDLRKPRYGNLAVEKRRVCRGLYEYRMGA